MLDHDLFKQQLLTYLPTLHDQVNTPTGDWTVKGFIDLQQRIYTISLDTKVLSKVLELLMFPVLSRFAQEQGYDLILAPAQNYYPDLTLIAHNNPQQCFAVDIKTTYRLPADQQGEARISGMTLGTFGGYFRIRDRAVSSTLPYNRYVKHYVLGVVYSRTSTIDERRVYDITQLPIIPSVAADFQFFLQEKYQIASDGPGSGNTKNIGSTKYLSRLLNGTGVFSQLGVDVFDDYWINYRTREMARAEGLAAPPYTNLKSYQAYKQQGAAILALSPEQIESEAAEQNFTEASEADFDSDET